MSNDITFYFIRHGYSCSNLNKKRINKIDKLKDDSHLTNWGILSSIYSGLYLQDTFFKDVKFDYTFCSPLIRTWETAACMFSNKYNNFTVAPFLNEINKGKKSPKPTDYTKNIEEYYKFINYINFTCDKSLSYITENLNNEHLIKKQIKYINKCNIIYDKDKYSSSYTYNGNLEKFIKWFINKKDFSKKMNVLVICHNNLMLNFLDKYHSSNYYKYSVISTNNFSFRVNVTPKKIQEPVIYFLGIKNPIGNEEEIDIDCSLCNLNKCDSKNDKNIHLDLIKYTEKYIL